MNFRFAIAFKLLFALLILSPGISQAEDVRAIVTSIVASNTGNDFDLDNDAYRDKILKLFSYSSYKQTNSEQVSLAGNTPQTLALVEGYELSLSIKENQGDKILVQALISKDGTSYIDTVLSVVNPGVVFLGGPATENGDLIIVIEAGL